MKANELRIGNWVNHEEHGSIKVNDLPYMVDIDNEKEGYLINEMWLDEHQPISLTPEILEKAGFVEFPSDATEIEVNIEYLRLPVTDGYISQYPNGKFYVSGMYQPDFYGAEANIKHLHQLQNLYFALTGE